MSVSMETDRSMVGNQPSERLRDSQRVVSRSLLVLSIFELILVGFTWPIWSQRSTVPVSRYWLWGAVFRRQLIGLLCWFTCVPSR